jgi:hypothetical protein
VRDNDFEHGFCFLLSLSLFFLHFEDIIFFLFREQVLYRSQPDNQIELTLTGYEQARLAAQRIKNIIRPEEVKIVRGGMRVES